MPRGHSSVTLPYARTYSMAQLRMKGNILSSLGNQVHGFKRRGVRVLE